MQFRRTAVVRQARTTVSSVSLAKYDAPVYCGASPTNEDPVLMSPERLLPLNEAIAVTIGERSQTDLARKLGVGQSAISKWVRGEAKPSFDVLAHLEDLCERPRGFILRAAGYVDCGTFTVLDAIERDPALDDLGRRILRASYEAARAADRLE